MYQIIKKSTRVILIEILNKFKIIFKTYHYDLKDIYTGNH